MSTPSGFEIRPATDADRPAIMLLGRTGFGHNLSEATYERYFSYFGVTEGLVATDAGRVVGVAMSATMDLRVPGDVDVAALGVSSVVTASSHRRRGILRNMISGLHTRAASSGHPVALLTASQGGIYGRFGYGPAALAHSIRLDRRFAEFGPWTPDPGGVAIVSIAEVADTAPAIYERWRHGVPGAQVRPDADWAELFADRSDRRGGGTNLFAFLHPDGYALYRYHRDGGSKSVGVVEFRAVTVEAHAALWRALLGLELCDEIVASVAPDDPLPYLLLNPRLVRTTGITDSAWVRMLDVATALAARRYLADLDVVLDVEDPLGVAGGRFALTVTSGEARVARTSRQADVEFGIDVLGSLYLGGHRASSFAAANRLRTKDVRHIRALDTAFASERLPQLGRQF